MASGGTSAVYRSLWNLDPSMADFAITQEDDDKSGKRQNPLYPTDN